MTQHKKSRMSGIQRDMRRGAHGAREPLTPKELREYTEYGVQLEGDQGHQACMIAIIRLQSEVRALRCVNKKLIKLIDEVLESNPVSPDSYNKILDYLYQPGEAEK